MGKWYLNGQKERQDEITMKMVMSRATLFSFHSCWNSKKLSTCNFESISWVFAP